MLKPESRIRLITEKRLINQREAVRGEQPEIFIPPLTRESGLRAFQL